MDLEVEKRNSNDTKEEYDSTFTKEKRNPIIFARTETSHLPKSLQHETQIKDVTHTIYSTNKDGSLKQTTLSRIDEEESLLESNRPSFWKRIKSFFTCCTGKEVVQAVETPTSDTLITSGPFLGEQRPCDLGKKTLVLDLDETLVHSSFQPSQSCQYTIPVEIEGNIYNVYVYRRPGALEFIRHMSTLYEVVIYTASLQKYADPLLDQMDPDHHIAYRLFRDHCVSSDGVFVKDLGLLGRDLKSVIMIDNAAVSYKFQPKNGIECIPFIDDFSDQELMQLTPFLEYLVKKPDVRLYAKLWNETRESQNQIVTYKK